MFIWKTKFKQNVADIDPKKEIVDSNEMCDRIKAAVDAKYDNNFVLMARTDALAIEGLKKP